VLFLGDPPSLLPSLWEVGEEEVAGDREREGDDAVDDEEPAPYR
jgi:hypothetical protein